MRAAIGLLCLCGCDVIWRIDHVRGDAGVGGADAIDAPTIDAPPSFLCMLGTSRQLPSFPPGLVDPSMSPDGLELYYGNGIPSNWDLFVARRTRVDEDFSVFDAVPELTSSSSDVDPAVVDGGRRILFASDRTGSHELFEAMRDGPSGVFGNVRRVDIAGVGFLGLEVSPDAKTLYFDDAGQLYAMTRVNDTAPFGGAVLVTTGVSYPSIAGDGLSLYYSSGDTVWRQTRATIAETFRNPVMMFTEVGAGDPDISEDGRTLVYRNPGGLAMRKCQ